MSVIPCAQDEPLRQRVLNLVEILKTQSHLLGAHGLSEQEFYDSGLFRGAIEVIRGQFAASMREKRDFVSHILNWMQDQGVIKEWFSAGESNRHDYTVEMHTGTIAVIELKGCLDGNNTTIYERPPHANEFILWSICQNAAADPRHNVWSGIHTRLSADIISRQQQVDGLIVWDMACGTVGRPCPKLEVDPTRVTQVGPYNLPPPCIYLFPATVPSPRNNPNPVPQSIQQVEFLDALNQAFGGADSEINRVSISVAYSGSDTLRQTVVERGGVVVKQSRPTAIRRT
jgi:hypothetical protein